MSFTLREPALPDAADAPGTGAQATVHHPDGADDTAVLVVVAVEDQALQRRVGILAIVLLAWAYSRAIAGKDEMGVRVDQLGSPRIVWIMSSISPSSIEPSS